MADLGAVSWTLPARQNCATLCHGRICQDRTRGMQKPVVVVGLVGKVLDASGRRNERWQRWRPSVSLCQQDDLVVQRFELLHHPGEADLARVVAADIATVSPETQVRLHLLDVANAWDFEAMYGGLFEFARSMAWQPEAEDLLVHITTGSHVAQICLFLLTEARELPGRLLQTSPVRGGRHDGLGSVAIIDLDLQRYDRIAARFGQQRETQLAFLKAGIDTQNPQFNQLISEIEHVARASTAPLLLSGPTGAGKTVLARRIYTLKQTARQLTGPLVEVNCATLRGDTAMSTLFGHVRGAFTGAIHAREGLLRQADRGLLFLDEIGELGPDEQAMLLRAIEDQRFLPMGSDREVSTRFQLIAGTNRDLAQQVRAGRFRDDLLARLATWHFCLPSLAQRREDIAPNLDWELDRVGRQLGVRLTFSREARARMLAFALSPQATWNHNFRDLDAAVARMATLAPGGRIRETEVDAEIARLTASWGTQSPEPADRGDVVREVLGPAAAELDRFDRVQLADVIGVCRTQPSLSEAGRALFGQSRRRKASRNDADRLRKYLARFGLTFDGLAAAADGSMRDTSGDAADRLERTANFAFDAAGRRA